MVNGLEFFQRKEIKDVLAYLHLLNNPQDAVALLRVINEPPRGIGKTTIGRLNDHAATRGLPLLEAARRARQIDMIGPRPAIQLTAFAAIMDRLARAIDGPIEELLGLVLSETGYQRRLSESENEDDQQRLANIEELLTVAREYDERRGKAAQLEQFLEETCLVNETDAWEVDADRVTLMTLHASKGLEFPVVYLTAVEEGILPHERSREHPEQLEEERRLMFVGITRAQQELQLSLARYRDFRGQRKLTIPSSYLMELPRSEMDLAFPEPESNTQTPCAVADRSDDDFHHDDVLDESVHDDTVLQQPARPERSPLPPTIRLTTAAALVNGGEPFPPVDPEIFRQGMWVLHSQYGLGQIIAVSGAATRRKATIVFQSPAGRQSVPLADGSLRPMRG